ncbi:FadR/GntR family transcriptional regulator [Sphingomonas turrisvirgatae]|uniref:GntR family transcriptional regulator n=1 Tax=Sphingomonas turrisvirgatae TaxID=1888892 RepID=A0A1E3M0Q9_9SPHN|nr:FCD domain-containing protein [Sphingomonas turrisvirgatae]ODP39561.1 GntR family transcriptional regulator [Sphingomonas turrisvirgatae]
MNDEAAAPQRTRRRPRLSTAVVEDLVNAIVAGTYPPGTALPPENMLCDMYDVSRTVVREATTALTEKGLVVSQQGRGTIVRDSRSWNMLDPAILSALFQGDEGLRYLDNLSEVRTLLESAMAAKAAANATPELVAELAAQVETLERLVTMPSAYVHEDLKFHDIIMRMSGDRLSKAIIDGIQSEALRTHGYSGKLSVEHVRATQDAHRKVYEAIAAGDADAAEDAMREHISGSWTKRRARPRA